MIGFVVLFVILVVPVLYAIVMALAHWYPRRGRRFDPTDTPVTRELRRLGEEDE